MGSSKIVFDRNCGVIFQASYSTRATEENICKILKLEISNSEVFADAN